MKSSRTAAGATTTADVDHGPVTTAAPESLTVGDRTTGGGGCGVRQRRATIPLSSRRCALRWRFCPESHSSENESWNKEGVKILRLNTEADENETSKAFTG